LGIGSNQSAVPLIVGEGAAGASEMSRAEDDSGISLFKSKKGRAPADSETPTWSAPVILAPLALGQHDAAEVLR
jgi:hypothetical protein